MENEKQKTETKPEAVKEGTSDVAPSYIDRAERAAKLLQEENIRIEKNIKELQDLRAFEVLGGKSEGAEQEAPKKEISDIEYAKKVMQGEIGFQ